MTNSPGLDALPVGSLAPDFSLRDQNNEVVSLSRFAGQKAVLLVFYPFAFTGICTGELGQIGKHLDTFVSDEVQVLAVSIDSSYSHKIFAQRDELDFPLLSDFWPHGAVAQAYGVFNDEVGVANRGTFLIDRHGIIRFSEVNEIGFGRDPQRWLDAISELGAPVG
ncbi:peroxiredoxin [Jatrophihabitans telluris]|uniref:Peroxiredoxin n=1 Tax=Jatrophihabitans telluris TaxID=2038343 RepID=A0ABY4QWG6_9ACTN|nr:peroxiredoxin [Jatrophihabitans telluris]UQX87309.1 peroxiredoxin [Jatrophihabitans telluris]